MSDAHYDFDEKGGYSTIGKVLDEADVQAILEYGKHIRERFGQNILPETGGG